MRVTGCVRKGDNMYWWYVFEGDEIVWSKWNWDKPDSSAALAWDCAYTRWGARIGLRRAMRKYLKAGGIEIYKGEIKDGEVNVQRG